MKIECFCFDYLFSTIARVELETTAIAKDKKGVLLGTTKAVHSDNEKFELYTFLPVPVPEGMGEDIVGAVSFAHAKETNAYICRMVFTSKQNRNAVIANFEFSISADAWEKIKQVYDVYTAIAEEANAVKKKPKKKK